MSIGVLLVVLVIVGLLLAYLPIDAQVRNIIAAVVGVVALIVVLRYAGLL